MKRQALGIVLSLAAGIAAAQAPASQKVAALDLVHTRARGTFPRGIKCTKATEHPTGDLALTVAPLKKSVYSAGDTIVYTLRIENAGTKPFSIPWSPDPGVLPKQRQEDRYIVSSFRVAAYSKCGAANLPESDLYGDPSVAKSWLTLQPHQYAEVTIATRVRGLAACSDSAPSPVQLRITMAQSAPALRADGTCTISFFEGYHVDKPVMITLAPPAARLKKTGAN
jgi:hypothetical protein